tara:strand:+ start:12618 stop:13523 length:906 start_codon:yes stop_codon:yes gene_type:complete
MEIGYACINMTLGSQKPRITTNRGMIKKTFQNKGIEYASSLALENVKDLIHIINWNHKNNINFYRMSSDIFPWMSEYNFEDLPHYSIIKSKLSEAGSLANSYKQRLTFHPGPFNVLCSPKDKVVKNTISELNKHSKIMDMMKLSKTHYNKINIHVGGVYGDKISAMNRWVDNFSKLDDGVKSRLTIENDDKESCYTVEDLMYIHNRTNVPIVFDYHHHSCHSGGITHKKALNIAVSTWPENITPAVHISEPRDEKNKRAHHDYIKSKVDNYGLNIDIMMEAKAKELAVIEYRNTYKELVLS